MVSFSNDPCEAIGSGWQRSDCKNARKTGDFRTAGELIERNDIGRLLSGGHNIGSAARRDDYYEALGKGDYKLAEEILNKNKIQ